MTAFWGDQGNIGDKQITCLEIKVVNYAAPHEQNEAEVGIFFFFHIQYWSKATAKSVAGDLLCCLT